jgi:hypothetical protein
MAEKEREELIEVREREGVREECSMKPLLNGSVTMLRLCLAQLMTRLKYRL